MKRKMEMSIRGNPEGSQLILMWQTVLDLIAVYFYLGQVNFFFRQELKVIPIESNNIYSGFM
jgi:hypothetical protein